MSATLEQFGLFDSCVLLYHPPNSAALKPPLKSVLMLARIVAALTILDDVDILDRPIEQG